MIRLGERRGHIEWLGRAENYGAGGVKGLATLNLELVGGDGERVAASKLILSAFRYIQGGSKGTIGINCGGSHRCVIQGMEECLIEGHSLYPFSCNDQPPNSDLILSE